MAAATSQTKRGSRRTKVSEPDQHCNMHHRDGDASAMLAPAPRPVALQGHECDRKQRVSESKRRSPNLLLASLIHSEKPCGIPPRHWVLE